LAGIICDATVRFQMHYHKEPGPGTGVWDETIAAIKFWEPGAKIDHVLQIEPLGHFAFKIPPGAPDYTVSAQYQFRNDATILAINPHMHLRGKAAKYTAFLPGGGEEAVLDVPKYDFNWQTTYELTEPKRLPKGTTLLYSTTYDNSSQNKSNPDPNIEVRWGEQTWEEMIYGDVRFRYTDEVASVVPTAAKPAQTSRNEQ
jgi:hypothetical protein